MDNINKKDMNINNNKMSLIKGKELKKLYGDKFYKIIRDDMTIQNIFSFAKNVLNY